LALRELSVSSRANATFCSPSIDANLALEVRPCLKQLNGGLRHFDAAGAAPIGLVAMAAIVPFVAPELACDGFVPAIADRWIGVGDLRDVLVYMALVVLIYVITVAARCPRYILAAGLLTWFSVLYGMQGILVPAAWAIGLVLIQLTGLVPWKPVEALPFVVGLGDSRRRPGCCVFHDFRSWFCRGDFYLPPSSCVAAGCSKL
jgi:hypothetical protein